MENILITGANGQLGNELRELSDKHPENSYFFTDIEDLDICDYGSIVSCIEKNAITKVINCAAYNDVNKAEEDPDTAFRINVMGPANLAKAAAAKDIYLIHISTDYVFDGNKRSPYHESDRAYPISEYGRTKFAGEIEVKKAGGRSIIIRTAWLYSVYGKNFVKKMIELGYANDELKVVNDQLGTPTCAKDLAEAILHILPQLDGTARYGEVFHYTDEGFCSWAEFAAKIMSLYRLECDILPILSEEYPSPAARPKYSVLDKSLIRDTFGVVTPQWERSLGKVIRTLERNERKRG